jgi:hypothetical protein
MAPGLLVEADAEVRRLLDLPFLLLTARRPPQHHRSVPYEREVVGFLLVGLSELSPFLRVAAADKALDYTHQAKGKARA